jgi:hypothetical protein
MIGHKRLTRNMEGRDGGPGRKAQWRPPKHWEVDTAETKLGPVRTLKDMTPEDLEAIQARLVSKRWTTATIRA